MKKISDETNATIFLVIFAVIIGIIWHFVETRLLNKSGTDLEVFFNKNVASVIEKLDNKKYPVPVIQKRYNDLLNSLVKKNPEKRIGRYVSPTYFEGDHGICVLSQVEHELLIVQLIAPALLDKKKQIDGNASNPNSKNFEFYVAIHFVKELSKLGQIEEGVDIDQAYAEEIELLSWADVCETILVPLSKEYGEAYTKQMKQMVCLWEEYGRKNYAEWSFRAKDNLVGR